jgi:alkylated DNA repair protein alkB family protein 8
MEKKHVYEVYEKIAEHFSHTRYKGWPKIVDFLNALPDGSVVADVGCGNGKYLGVNPNIQMIGTDRSRNLMSQGREKDENH